MGTRGSALALAQTGLVARALEGLEPGLTVEVVPIRTSGDEAPSAAITEAKAAADGGALGDKSRFTKEIEDALLDGRVDLAVHSAKDVPGELPDGLAIVGVPERADPRDALCGAASIGDLPSGARIGTSSLRRRAQLAAVRPDLAVEDLRGNVDTRLRRLAEGRHHAVVLAMAGLERLGRAEDGFALPAQTMLPAAGQGCLALEGRAHDGFAEELAGRLTHRESLLQLTCERALVTALGATCRTPVAAHAEIHEDTLRLAAFAGLPDGSEWLRDELEGSIDDPAGLGTVVAERLMAAGVGSVLARAEKAAHLV